MYRRSGSSTEATGRLRNPSTATNTNVVMWPSVGMGHLIPFCSLATRLAQQSGCSVTLILVDTFFHSPRACLHLARLAKHSNIHLLPLPQEKKLSTTTQEEEEEEDRHISAAANNNTDCIMDQILATSMSTLPHVLQILDGLQDCVLIVDMFCVAAMGPVERLGIPWYLFFTSPAALLSLMLLTPHMDINSWLSDDDAQLRLPGLPPLLRENLPDGMLDRLTLPKLLASFNSIANARAIFINTFHELDASALQSLTTEHSGLSVPPLYAIGPLLENESESESHNSENECIRWLDRQPAGSVVLVSFGSAAALGKLQLNEIGQGLRASGQRFLWVVTEKSSDTASRGDAYFQDAVNDGAGISESACGGGMVVTSWVPQVAILRHRSTGGFVTHCGWNSVMESICCGVPMVAWPMFAEQKMNAVVMVEQYGVALRMRIGKGDGLVKKEEVARSVRELMQGDDGGRARRRVAHLKFKAAQAVAHGGSSYYALADAIKHWQL